MAYVIDANIYLRTEQEGHPQQAEAQQAVATLLQRQEKIYLIPQNLYEFWNVCTRPIANNGLGLTHDSALEYTQKLLKQFVFLPDDQRVFEEWLRIVVSCKVSGVQVHDARIAAAMRVHGITHILTFNTNDFKRFERITAVHPSELE